MNQEAQEYNIAGWLKGVSSIFFWLASGYADSLKCLTFSDN